MAVTEELGPGIAARVTDSPSLRLAGRRLLAAIPVLFGVTFAVSARLIRSHASGDEQSGHVVSFGCGQSFPHKVFDDGALKRCDKIQSQLVAV